MYDVVNVCINVVKCFIIESFEVIIILWLKARVIATLILVVTWPKGKNKQIAELDGNTSEKMKMKQISMKGKI